MSPVALAPASAVPSEEESTLTVELTVELKPAAARTEVLRLWRRLEQELGNDRLACSADWTECWLDHYGDLIPHRFALAWQGRELRGVGLLTNGVHQTDGPFHVATLHLGTAGEPRGQSVHVEYNTLLIEEPFRGEFLRSLLAAVHEELDWDEFRLEGFEADELASLVGCDDDSFDVRVAESRYFDLQAARVAGTDALAQLGYATRKVIRKNLKAYGPLDTEWAETVAQGESIYDDLVRLHQARWTAVGKPGAYADPRFHGFHRELIHYLLPRGKVGLFRVTQGDEVIGCTQLYFDRNRALVYQGGAAPYYGKLSPGLVVDYLCLEECLRRGFDAFDFLAGDSLHKQRLTTDCHTLVWAYHRRGGHVRHAIADGLRTIKSALQQLSEHCGRK